jgi:nitrite reductase (NO-forming)
MKRLIVFGVTAAALALAGCGAQPTAEPTPAAPTPAVAQALALDVPNVVRDPADVPPPITRTEPTTVRVTLTVQELVSELADGTSYSFWTFDGTVPGPMIRVMEGDTVELTLVNPDTNSVGHNIDLHAVNGPGGGAAVTNVLPGESKTFSFKALNPGLYIYHCAFAPPWHHIAQGMYGGILVEPAGGLPKVDHEFYVIQGEWYTSAPFGTKGHMDFDNAKAFAEQPEYFTFNGNVAALTEMMPLEAEVGDTVRVYFGVGGPNVGSNFHIIGEIFDRVFTGAPETYIANEETWYVPPGSFAAFEFTLNEPGTYLLVDHALFRVAHGAAGKLIVSGEHDESIYSPVPEGSGHP